jgi:predicted  nucleic acid-binding Zn-ribbon protein
MEISITKAAKEWGISRVTLHKKINEGMLSKQENGTLETSEMVRVFGEPKVKVNSGSDVKAYSNLQPEIGTLHLKIQHLESDLQLQKELTRKSEERETWLQNQVGNLTDTIKLLDAPKAPKITKINHWQTWSLVVVCVALVAVGAIALRALNYI